MNSEYINPQPFYYNPPPIQQQRLQQQDEFMPGFLLIIGFCFPCLWLINYCLYINSSVTSSRIFGKLSLSLFIGMTIMYTFMLLFMYYFFDIIQDDLLDQH
jgi:hypothetical protein